MSNIAIFKNQNAVTTTGKRELSDLAKSLASSLTTRRIQTSINGTFKRVVNGEQIGNAVRGEINVIIVSALPKVSRVFYAEKYDPDGEATLPNCWSNLGDKPESAAADPQSTSCATCPQNIKGSGGGDRRACRYQRRISVLVEGDDSGDVYQFNVPSKSLFGKGTGNVHPFESYIKFLIANGESPDNVVTNVSYDANAEGMELLFTPVRNVTDEEYEMIKSAQARPETKAYTTITVAQADKVTKQPEKVAAKPAAPVVSRSEEPEEVEEPTPAPTKREKTKAKQEASSEAKPALADVLSAWGDED